MPATRLQCTKCDTGFWLKSTWSDKYCGIVVCRCGAVFLVWNGRVL